MALIQLQLTKRDGKHVFLQDLFPGCELFSCARATASSKLN